MNFFEQLIETLQVGAPSAYRNLTVFPLFREAEGPADYVTLDEALASGQARVTEVSESGHVPHLRFVNDSDTRVLLLDGEELVGARQNRTLNLSILVAEHSETIIPVTCVEQGRWRYTRSDFVASGRIHFARGRARKLAGVTERLKTAGRPDADQMNVWQELGSKASRMGVSSRTGAMGDIFDRYAADLQAHVEAHKVSPGQQGAAFAINGSVVGLELFDRAGVCARLLPKIIRSYALDAIEARHEGSQPVENEAVQRFLREALEKAEATSYPGVGIGSSWRFVSRAAVAAALVAGERVIHLCAFAVQADPPGMRKHGPLADLLD